MNDDDGSFKKKNRCMGISVYLTFLIFASVLIVIYFGFQTIQAIKVDIAELKNSAPNVSQTVQNITNQFQAQLDDIKVKHNLHEEKIIRLQDNVKTLLEENEKSSTVLYDPIESFGQIIAEEGLGIKSEEVWVGDKILTGMIESA